MESPPSVLKEGGRLNPTRYKIGRGKKHLNDTVCKVKKRPTLKGRKIKRRGKRKKGGPQNYLTEKRSFFSWFAVLVSPTFFDIKTKRGKGPLIKRLGLGRELSGLGEIFLITEGGLNIQETVLLWLQNYDLGGD